MHKFSKIIQPVRQKLTGDLKHIAQLTYICHFQAFSFQNILNSS